MAYNTPSLAARLNSVSGNAPCEAIAWQTDLSSCVHICGSITASIESFIGKAQATIDALLLQVRSYGPPSSWILQRALFFLHARLTLAGYVLHETVSGSAA